MKKTIILSLALTFASLPLAHPAYAVSCDPYAHPGTCAANEICEGDINGGNKGTCVTTAPDPKKTSAASNTVTPSNTAQSSASFVPLTQFPQIKELAAPTAFGSFVNTMYKVLIGIGSVLAVIMIMIAGVQFMTSRGSVTSNEKAKSRIQNALYGLLLLLAPTIVFGIINPEILHLNFGTEFAGLKLSTLKQDAFKSQTPTQSTQSQANPAICSSIKQKALVPIASGQDAASVCSAKGKGWAHYGEDCCAFSGTGQVCCGYDPANDQNTPAPPTAEEKPGQYRYTMYWGDKDYSTGAYCVSQGTQHETTQAACTASLNASANSHKSVIYAVSDNCDGSTAVKPVVPQSSYDKLKNLPACS